MIDLQAEGENVDKLEKADILEFTVKHLQKITRRDPVEEAYKFQVRLKMTCRRVVLWLIVVISLQLLPILP